MKTNGYETSFHLRYPYTVSAYLQDCNSALPAAIRLDPVPDGPGVILALWLSAALNATMLLLGPRAAIGARAFLQE